MIPTIPEASVAEVLLDDGVWRPVGFESFSVDVLEARGTLLVAHTPACGDQCNAGFAFATPDGVIIAGPLGRLHDVR